MSSAYFAWFGPLSSYGPFASDGRSSVASEGSPTSSPRVPPVSGAQFPQPEIPNLRSLVKDSKLKIPMTIPELKVPKLKITKAELAWLGWLACDVAGCMPWAGLVGVAGLRLLRDWLAGCLAG